MAEKINPPTVAAAEGSKSAIKESRDTEKSLSQSGQIVNIYRDGRGASGAVPAEREHPAALPCLYRNNSTENDGIDPLSISFKKRLITPEGIVEKWIDIRDDCQNIDRNGHIWNEEKNEREAGHQLLVDAYDSGQFSKELRVSSYEWKVGWSLQENAKAFIVKHSLSNVGFLTLTFRENVKDPREANRRFNSLRTHILKELFPDFIVVVEPQKRGAVHYHLLVACSEDIRTGFDFEAVANRNYSSATPYLREVWSKLRKAMPKYGFGRSELLPILKTGPAVALYVGKYIGKGAIHKSPQFKGFRMVRYAQQGARSVRSGFTWVEKGREWREWLSGVGNALNVPYDQMTDKFGRFWAFKLLSMRDAEPDISPSLAAFYLRQIS